VGVKVASYDKEYHRDIMQHIGANKEQVLGWGRIVIDEQTQTIKLYDESTEFGKVVEEYHEALSQILNKTYPEYNIQIQ
jgi:hypothetical protein